MKRTIQLTACIALCSCDVPQLDGPAGELVQPVASGACYNATAPIGGGNPAFQILPRSTIVADFTRPMFPHTFTQGSWSTPRWVSDSHGFQLPAISATTGLQNGFMSLPFNSGETLVGVSLNICNDATTILIADTFASQFSIGSQDNFTDSLVGTGSIATGGTPGQWRTVDIGMEPLFMQDNSTLWLDFTAVQTSGASPPPPPVASISQIVMHLNR
jgi:hypothetical protein